MWPTGRKQLEQPRQPGQPRQKTQKIDTFIQGNQGNQVNQGNQGNQGNQQKFFFTWICQKNKNKIWQYFLNKDKKKDFFRDFLKKVVL